MIGWTREVIELATIALARFANLTESEMKIVVAVTTGEIAFCGPDPDSNHQHNDPDFADFWGLERDIRAELIRWLCVDPNAGARIDPRGLQIHAARISGELDLSHAVVRFPLLLSRCRIAKAMYLYYTQMEFLGLSESLVPGIDASGIRIRGELILRGRFRADGGLILISAEIGGSLDCRGGKFVKPDGDALCADRIKVTGSVFLSEGFCAKGEVRLLGANIGGNLDCKNGRFVKSFKPDGYALNADGIKVIGSVFLSDGFSAEGGVNLVGASVGGDLEILRAKFAVGSCIRIERATVKGLFAWRALVSKFKGELHLGHSSVGLLSDDRKSWPEAGNLYLDGFVYTRIAAGPFDSEFRTDTESMAVTKSPTDAKGRIEWLANQPRNEFTPQPYQQLAKVLREAGDKVGARQVLVAMENVRHKREKLGAFGRPWHWILWWTIGYGYRPGQALWSGLGIVLLGFFLFSRGYRDGVITPIDKEAYQAFETHNPNLRHGDPPSYYQAFSAPVYSLDTFLPIINLGQKDRWTPDPHNGNRWKPRWAWLENLTKRCFARGWPTSGSLLRFYLWIHIGLGWLLTTLFVAGFTSIVRNE